MFYTFFFVASNKKSGRKFSTRLNSLSTFIPSVEDVITDQFDVSIETHRDLYFLAMSGLGSTIVKTDSDVKNKSRCAE